MTGYDANDNVITKEGNVIKTGSYKEPSPTDSMYKFDHWSANPDGLGDAIDVNSITSDITLYAVYEEDLIASGAYGCA